MSSAAEKAEEVTGELLLFDPNKLAVFDEFTSQMAELQEYNQKAVFDYSDPKGNKEARSHIHTLRQTKSSVEKARVEAKQVSLNYGRAVDSRAKELKNQFEEMIEVHKAPLDEIERIEAERIEKHVDNLQWLRDAAADTCIIDTAEEIQIKIDQIHARPVDESLEEFFEEGKLLKAYALSEMAPRLEAAQKAEKEAAELQRLRDEDAERNRRENEERIRKDADAEATRRAENKATQERQELEREQQERNEKAAQDLREANERTEKAAQDERDRIAREQKEAEEAQQKRDENKRIRTRVINKAAAEFKAVGFSDAQAFTAVSAIVDGKIPSVTITF